MKNARRGCGERFLALEERGGIFSHVGKAHDMCASTGELRGQSPYNCVAILSDFRIDRAVTAVFAPVVVGVNCYYNYGFNRTVLNLGFKLLELIGVQEIQSARNDTRIFSYALSNCGDYPFVANAT